MNHKFLTLAALLLICTSSSIFQNAFGDEIVSAYQPVYTMNAGNDSEIEAYKQPLQAYHTNDNEIVAANINEVTFIPSWGEDDDSDVISHFDPRYPVINCITDPTSCRDFEVPDGSSDGPLDLGTVDDADRTIETDTDDTGSGETTATYDAESPDSSSNCVGAAAPCEDNSALNQDPQVSYADLPDATKEDWVAYQGDGGCSLVQNAQTNARTLLSALIFAVSSLPIIVRRKVDSV